MPLLTVSTTVKGKEPLMVVDHLGSMVPGGLHGKGRESNSSNWG